MTYFEQWYYSLHLFKNRKFLKYNMQKVFGKMSLVSRNICL
jgi:hypothetical protein